MRKLIVIGAIVAYTTVAPGLHPLTGLSNKELKCLADNVYYEARGEPFEGKKLVARVTINRTLHPDYPDSICGVVYQPHQFSWTMKKQKKPIEAEYAEAKWAALHGVYAKSAAIFYHNVNITPAWAKAKIKEAKVGNHVFYY